MFEKITAPRDTRPARLRRGIAASLAAHAGFAAVVASVPLASPAPEAEEELVTHLWIPAPVDPAAPAAAPARAAAARDEAADDGAEPAKPAAREPARTGPRLTLQPPAAVPDGLPDVRPAAATPALAAAAGEGSGAASALIRAMLPETPGIRARVPMVAAEELAEPPRMLNRNAVLRTLARDYPRRLEVGGIVGDVVVAFIVGTDGWVEMESVYVVSASHQEFVEPTLRGLQRMRFRPARLGGTRVRVRTTMPVVWTLPDV